MENKRKIWVRVAAFMAAIICCVICVVPAYAEEGETNLAQQQEEVLNSMVGEGIFWASQYVVDLDYRDVKTYVAIDSTPFSVYGEWPLEDGFDVNNGGYCYVAVYDANGVQVSQYGITFSKVEFAMPTIYNLNTRVLFRDTISNRYFSIGARYEPDVNEVSFRFVDGNSGGYYQMSDGYTFKGFCVQFEVPADSGCFYYFAEKIYNPSFLLSLNVGGGDDEAYNQGYAAGYQFGFEEGEMHGLEEGLDRGREEGYTEGDADGYRRGYDDGMHQTSLIDGIKSLFRAPMEFVESALNFEIFGIDLGDAVKALVSMMLLALVVTIVWKAVK